ncbi:MAG: hypothetical protein JWM99_276 [Verrucomicrobiales bacterium]|jgi:hypothetical protein|nr:hypothetical protein [Verrucomicrobiales bacterium]
MLRIFYLNSFKLEMIYAQITEKLCCFSRLHNSPRLFIGFVAKADKVFQPKLKTMNTNQLVPRYAVLLALSMFAGTSTFALTPIQAKAVRTAVTSVPVPEMGSKAVELILHAEKQDREIVAVTAVRAIVFRHKTSASAVVATVSKAVPEVAAVVAAAAAELSHSEASHIIEAASLAAPTKAADIQMAVSQTLSPFSRGEANSGGPSSGTITSDEKPINQENGGKGDGTFPSTKPNTASTPQPKDYSKPR